MELFPVQVFSLACQRVVRERVGEEMDVLPRYSASENVAVLLLLFPEEFQGVGTELQGTAQVWKEPVFKRWLTLSPAKHTQELSLQAGVKVPSPALARKRNTDARLFVTSNTAKTKPPNKESSDKSFSPL